MSTQQPTSREKLTTADYRRLLNLHQDGKAFIGECPACHEFTLRLAKNSAGQWRCSCQGNCARRLITELTKARKAEYLDLEQASARLSSHDDEGDEENADLDHDQGRIQAPEIIVPHNPTTEDWRSIAAQCQGLLNENDLDDLAGSLGVSVDALQKLGIGCDPAKRQFTFPERNAAGHIIGISTRSIDDSKGMLKGSKRGIYVPSSFPNSNGPIFIPEGASDVAAALTMGLMAVGRASAATGVKELPDLLKGVANDRDIVVMGEMDASATGKWIGKDSAIELAETLAAALGRTVYWALPPEGKDIRDCLKGKSASATLQDRGKSFLDSVMNLRRAVEPGAGQYKIQIVNAVDLLKQKIELTWLVENVLVQGQPVLMGGPQKSLKTTIALDLAISMVTGWPFLGVDQFKVPKKLNVCLLSGESGAATIQRTIRAQINAKKGLTADKLTPTSQLIGNLHVGFRLPQFAVVASVKAAEELLAAGKFDVLFIDPVYLCLTAGDSDVQASSIFDMGPRLLKVSELCQKYNVTPILLHHFPKSKGGQWKGKVAAPDLTDLAFAGFAEFARQWILLNRREPYQPGERIHKLNMTLGGSAGFSSCWALDINQGTLDTNFEGQSWLVEVRSQASQIEADRQLKADQQNLEMFKQQCADEQKVLEAIRKSKDGLYQAQIEKLTRFSRQKAWHILYGLREASRITEIE